MKWLEERGVVMDQWCLTNQKAFLVNVCEARPVLTPGPLTSGLVLTSSLNLFESVSPSIITVEIKSDQTKAGMLCSAPGCQAAPSAFLIERER